VRRIIYWGALKRENRIDIVTAVSTGKLQKGE
jgi:hypothetical protein